MNKNSVESTLLLKPSWICSGNAFEKFTYGLMPWQKRANLFPRQTGGMLLMYTVFSVFSCISNQVVTGPIALPYWSNCFQPLPFPWHFAAIFQVRTIDESYVTEKHSSCIMSSWVQTGHQLKGNIESTGDKNTCSYTIKGSKKKQSFFRKIIASMYSHNPLLV